jgi:hypothetical protein
VTVASMPWAPVVADRISVARVVHTLIIVAIVAPGCTNARAPSSDPSPEAYGYRQSFHNREFLLAAINDANILLRGQGTPLLHAGWLAPGSDAAIPVYAVDEGQLGPDEISFVPKGGRMILVSSNAGDSVAARAGRGEAVSASMILAFVLLHELGHLVTSTDPASPEMEKCIGPLSPDLKAELDADVRAGLWLRGATRFRADETVADRTADRMRAGYIGADPELDFVRNHPEGYITVDLLTELGFLQLEQSEPRFRTPVTGGSSIRSRGSRSNADNTREAFADRGLSHPNLEMRLLVILYTATGDADQLTALCEFGQHRRTTPTEGAQPHRHGSRR